MAYQNNSYDIFDSELNDYIAKSVKSKEVQQLLDIKPQYVSRYANSKYIYRGRYAITSTKVAPKYLTHATMGGAQLNRYKDAWGVEWDRVRLNPKLWKTIDDALIGGSE